MLKLHDYMRERSLKQKLILGGSFLATFLGIIAFSWFASRPNMALLYAGLESAQAGAVIAAVERSGVPYEVRGDSIWVREGNRDQLRMSLAGEGLPAAGSAGYELLDGMSGFGTTSQMFDAAYWRAKEGELARTILALPNIRTARVHLAVPTGRGYRRDSAAAASVTLTTSGSAVSQAQSRALRYLVSSGVPGLSPEAVTVIDSERGVIGADDDPASETRAAEMKRNVERILEAHVGAGNVIVEMNLDLVTEAELLTEQRFDPQDRVLISQESEESTDSNTNALSGAVSAASNLPDGQGSNGETSNSARSETRQRSNFEVSRITREVRKQPGDVRRLTVAVLVNGTVANGETTATPRPEPELQALRELVASAVGYDEGRGDQITVKSMPFADLAQLGTESGTRGLADRLALDSLLRLALIGVFAIVLVYIVLKALTRGQNGGNAERAALDRTAAPPGLPPAEEPATPDAQPEIDFVPMDAPSPDPVARLKELMRDRQDESMKILSGWIEKREDTA